jgi:hypothetical protein
MSSNQEVALEANFKSWRDKRFPTPPKDLNVFEYYCIEQFVRPFDISDSQLKSDLNYDALAKGKGQYLLKAIEADLKRRFAQKKHKGK